MLNYQTVTQRTAPTLRRYYENCDYRLCEYSVGTKLMWREELKPEWAEVSGCLVVRNEFEGAKVFDYPVVGPGGDEDAALQAVEEDCFERGIPLVFSIIPDSKAHVLLERYPFVHVYNIRTWKDYLYNQSDLAHFSGRRYSGQRNHIHKFRQCCPNAEFRLLGADSQEDIEDFWTRYDAEFGKSDEKKAVNELRYAKRMMRMAGKKWFRCGAFYDGGKIIAVALAEKCGETLIMHIEKALYSYEGIYPAFVQAFAGACGADVRYINREDDAADRGLRTSKLQYRPVELASKYCMRPINDLQEHIHEFPVLKTERLVLDEIKEPDIPAYNKLVLDRERNRWWGYDDEGSLPGPVQYDSFYRVAKNDWENHNAVNFALRLDGKLIGEAVIYNFDFRGGAEIGCRILEQYAGNGYGTEAFQAVADWALYKVHMVKVIAKCYHENAASFHMLSSCMKSTGHDETFDYFEKTV